MLNVNSEFPGHPISDISPAALAATRRGVPRRAPPPVPSGCFCTPTEGSVPMAVGECAPRGRLHGGVVLRRPVFRPGVPPPVQLPSPSSVCNWPCGRGPPDSVHQAYASRRVRECRVEVRPVSAVARDVSAGCCGLWDGSSSTARSSAVWSRPCRVPVLGPGSEAQGARRRPCPLPATQPQTPQPASRPPSPSRVARGECKKDAAPGGWWRCDSDGAG